MSDLDPGPGPSSPRRPRPPPRPIGSPRGRGESSAETRTEGVQSNRSPRHTTWRDGNIIPSVSTEMEGLRQSRSNRVVRFLPPLGNEAVSDTDPDPDRLRISGREGQQKATRILYTTDEEVRDALMEFGVFIIFLILTSLVTLSVRHSYMFYFNDTMKKQFAVREMVVMPSVTISFEKLITVQDFWNYLLHNFLVTLHGDMSIVNTDGSHIDDGDSVDYYEEPPPEPGEEGPPEEEGQIPATEKPDVEEDANEDDDEDEDEVLDDKKRKRQKRRRQKRDNKVYNREHMAKGHTQYDYANMTHLEGRVFLHENLMLGPPRLRQIRVRKDSCYVNDAFIRYFNSCYAAYSSGAEQIGGEHGGAPYRTMSELDSTPLWTTLGFYRSGGYTINLTYNKRKNLQMIQDLRNKHWLDRGSRLCLIEFNLYNQNTDIFQSAKFIAEIPPTGGVIPQSQLQTVKQFTFLTDTSLTMSVIYIFWYIMVVYYNIFEIKAIRKSGFRNYFRSLINVLDSIILVFCYLALIYNVWHTINVDNMVSKAKFEESYQSLDQLCFWNTIYVDMMAILAFLVWIKIFKFISFNKTLVQFTTTLKRCSKDLAGFSLMFGIVFLAYAQLGLLLFGTKHPDFRNFVTSILTMIRMILGDFQYNLIEEANRVLGPIYFLTYILLVFFILLNMFLAIIMETYNSVKSEITQGRSQLGSYIYKKLTSCIYFITHCGRKRHAPPIHQRPNVDNQDYETDDAGKKSFQAPKVQLRRNMTEAEAQYFEDVPDDVRNKDMFRLNNRVSLLEEILEQLVSNMDGILKRVEREVKKNQ
ncbi:polycystic kidney disease 2-like 2 protein isoform X1 [Drosophila grimshawi]|uniref:GH11647 n=1 Tax=Drosophila grimshawi TaxID=7222 RepID=B4JCC3_DROGR|nr:polycystic kidney disease 2-like 2 protein isoform X2 [Drosophila grimshawi]XP_032592451.1 polycystic kidney disease 2-like 2 protein isoform X1 [Drosophila grimshawi]XP_032592452.1 polycystic kidney disease 2-like 2 protein isoform X1 [Drosophila grimshawi]EDW04156.1 GH11647 [Drosophila grimshawi]